MKIFAIFLCWAILFVLSWPLAILALLIFPFVWLLLLPLRLVGIVVHGVFALLSAIILLPARMLGYRSARPALQRPA